jgi:type III secretion system YscQ/HrcQ family protein
LRAQAFARALFAANVMNHPPRSPPLNVSPLSAERLPKVTARAAAASRALGEWLGGTEAPLEIDLGAAGVARIAFAGFETCELPSREELLLIGPDGRRGRCAVDGRLALAMVSACLGQTAISSPPILRGLGVGERGVLAAQVLAVMARLGTGVTVALGAPAALPAGEPLVSLALEAQAAAVRGRVRLDLPSAWLSSPTAVTARLEGGFAAAASRLNVVGALELAATSVPVSEWSAAGAGDAVVFDGAAPVSTAGDWSIGLRIGDYSAAASLDLDGSATIVGPFCAVLPRPRPRPPRPIKEIHTMSAQSSDESTRAVLAAAPIEVVAEIGRLTLRGDEVLGLAPGSVLAFGGRGLQVTLTAGGQAWARGDLVDVDGELGVRLTEML